MWGVALQDAHFPPAAVCHARGYRQLIVRQLAQIQVLDDVEVQVQERQAVEDAFLRRCGVWNRSRMQSL